MAIRYDTSGPDAWLDKINRKHLENAKASGFKIGDRIRLKATFMLGTIRSGPNYRGEYAVLRETGKYKGAIGYWQYDEFTLYEEG